MASIVRNEFGVVDYVVFSLVLVVSAAIGVYHGCRRRQGTVQDFLLGSRQMQLFPAALSMIASSLSAVTVIGWLFYT